MLPILNAFVDDGGRDIIFLEQTSEGPKERRTRAEYTTYHRSSDLDADLIRRLKKSDQVVHIVEETKRWTRIGWRDEWARRAARKHLGNEGIETFEGDVNPVRFWLTQGRQDIAKPRRCYLDIEGDSRVSFSKKEEMRVLCWAISDDTGPIAKGILVEDTDEAETKLLEKLWSVLDNYDQVCAWYGGSPDDKDVGFDFFVIAQRSHRLGLGVDTRRWLWLDQLVVWKRMNQAESGDEKESMRLEDIAQMQIGEGKEATPDWVKEKFGDKGLGALSWDLWNAGGKFRKLLVDYCVKDTELLRKLEAKKGFITLFQSICEVTAVFGSTQGLFPTGQMDGLCLRIGRDEDYRFGTKRYSDGDGNDEIKFKGAFVLEPRTVESSANPKTGAPGWTAEQAAEWRKSHGMTNGILRNLHMCDFASMYPANIITWNLSEDSLVDEDEVIEEVTRAYKAGEPVLEGYCYSPGTGVVTKINPFGILTIALRKLLEHRKKYAEEAKKYPPGSPGFVDAMAKSNACKVVANSFYGVAGASTSRFFNVDVARSTTQNGVWLTKKVIAEAEKRGIEAIYSDTDSAGVIGPTRDGFAKFVKWLNDKFLPDEIRKTGAVENRVKLEFEKSFDICIFTKKKRYCARPLHYKWKTTCSQCKKKDGKTPGAVDVRTLKCEDCGHQYTEAPPFTGKPEIKGLEFKRGDTLRMAREMQGQIIDLLVGGLKMNPGLEDVQRPILDLRRYEAIIHKWQDKVLNSELSVEEVRISKTIKDEKEYKSEPIHLAVAKILESRGRAITPGTRIEYVVIDASHSPQKVIPAEDYDGECDRFYLWETLVYPPARRLLEGAFPNYDWSRWEDHDSSGDSFRPNKPKKKKKVPENQLGFSYGLSPRGDTALEELAAPKFSSKPLTIRIPEEAGEAGMKRVKAALVKHPGARAVEIVIVLKSGAEAVLRSEIRVSTSPKLKTAVEEALAS